MFLVVKPYIILLLLLLNWYICVFHCLILHEPILRNRQCKLPSPQIRYWVSLSNEIRLIVKLRGGLKVANVKVLLLLMKKFLV